MYQSISVQKHYTLRWQLKGLPNIKISVCNRVFNTNTGRELKKSMVGYSKGFWIGSKFFTLKNIRANCEVIPHIDCPF
jgi:hypothetical protein